MSILINVQISGCVFCLCAEADLVLVVRLSSSTSLSVRLSFLLTSPFCSSPDLNNEVQTSTKKKITNTGGYRFCHPKAVRCVASL